MHKYKIGDKVRVKKYCSGAKPNKVYSLRFQNNVLITDTGDIYSGCSCQWNWILVGKRDIKQYGIVKFCQNSYK